MKRLIIIAVLASIAFSLTAEAKKKKEVAPNPNPESWVTKLKWSKPEKANNATIDDYYAQGDTIYKHLKDLASDIVFYDVKKIVNTDTGDTLVTVVDSQGNIRGKEAAFWQYTNALNIAIVTYEDLNKTIKLGKAIIKQHKELVKTDDTIKEKGSGGFFGTFTKIINVAGGVAEDATLISKLKKAGEEMGAMYYLVGHDLIKGFKEQRKKIRTLKKEISKPAITPYDPQLRNLPDLPLGDEVLSKSDKEILDGLANAEKEDESFIRDHGKSIFDNEDNI